MTRRYEIWTEQYLRQHQKRHAFSLYAQGVRLRCATARYFGTGQPAGNGPAATTTTNRSARPTANGIIASRFVSSATALRFGHDAAAALRTE